MEQQIQQKEDKKTIPTVFMTKNGDKKFDWRNFDLVKNLDLENARKEIIQSYAQDNNDVQKNGLREIFRALVYYENRRSLVCEDASEEDKLYFKDFNGNYAFITEKYIEILHMFFNRKNFRAKNTREVLCQNLLFFISYTPEMFDVIFEKMESCLFHEEICDAIETMLNSPSFYIFYRKSHHDNFIKIFNFFTEHFYEHNNELLLTKNFYDIIMHNSCFFQKIQSFFSVLEDILNEDQKQICATLLSLKVLINPDCSELAFYNTDNKKIEYIKKEDFTSKHFVIEKTMQFLAKNDIEYLIMDYVFYLYKKKEKFDIKTRKNMHNVLSYLYLYSDKIKKNLNKSASYSMLQSKNSIATLLHGSGVKRYDEIAREIIDQLI